MIHADKDEMNFEHSSKVKNLLKEVSQDLVKRYQKEPKLLEVLSKKHKLPKEQIFLESGVIGIIHRVYDYTLSEKSTVLIPELGYPYFRKLAARHGAKLKTFQVKKTKNGFEYSITNLLNKLKQKPDIVVIIDPESPLGFSTSSEDFDRIIKASNKKTLVFLDQSHEGFREEHQKDVSKLVKKYPNLLVARGFSKLFGLAGIRISYALCGNEVKKMINFKDKYLGFDSIAQNLAEAALDSEEHYRENAKKLRKEKLRLMQALKKTIFKVHGTDSSSVIVEISDKHKKVDKLAKEAGILIRNLEEYHDDLKNHYRVTLGPSEHTDKLIEFFEAASWLYNFEIKNAEAKVVFNTRSAGYTVHRAHLSCDKANIVLGWHRVIVPPGKKVSEHYHLEQDEQFEFFSDAIVKINGKEIQVRLGDIVNINPGDKHEIIAPENSFARFTALRYPYSLEDKYTSDGKKKVHEQT